MIPFATIRSLCLLLGAVLTLSPVAAEDRTSRIVALGGTVTETLYELGLGERIVAVDTTSVHPPEALATKPNVGYLRQLSAEGILSVRPSLVLALEGAGPPDILKIVAEAGVPIAHVPEDLSPSGVVRRVAAVAKETGQEDAGRKLGERIEAGLAGLAAMRSRVTQPVRALFILSAQNGRIMVGGRNTAADAMIGLAGAENVAAAIDGYRPMADEAIVAARPDVVVMISYGPGGEPPPGMLQGPALATTPAGRENRLVVMNGQYLLGFGPRTPEAARDLLLAFYPGLKE